MEKNEVVRTNMDVTVEAVGEVADRTLRFIASNETVDRYGTIISSSGWDLKAFKRNPVFVFDHNYSSPSTVIGRVVRAVKDTEKKALVTDVLFAPAEINPLAEMVYQMYTHKPPFLNAVSVGFIPLKTERIEEDSEEVKAAKGGRKPYLKYVQQELVELSSVVVPANPDALPTKGMGADEMEEMFMGIAEDSDIDPVLAMEARSILPCSGDEDERRMADERVRTWLKSLDNEDPDDFEGLRNYITAVREAVRAAVQDAVAGMLEKMDLIGDLTVALSDTVESTQEEILEKLSSHSAAVATFPAADKPAESPTAGVPTDLPGSVDESASGPASPEADADSSGGAESGAVPAAAESETPCGCEDLRSQLDDIVGRWTNFNERKEVQEAAKRFTDLVAASDAKLALSKK